MNPAPYTENTLIQKTTAEYLGQQLGWESIYAYLPVIRAPEYDMSISTIIITTRA